jgi:hypothetical protein
MNAEIVTVQRKIKARPETVIDQVQQHGIDVHNMRVTPDQVGAMVMT